MKSDTLLRHSNPIKLESAFVLINLNFSTNLIVINSLRIKKGLAPTFMKPLYFTLFFCLNGLKPYLCHP